MSRKRVLLVGGGLTSAMVARLLRDAALAGEIELHAWDRRDTIGGRASVEHCEQTGGTAEMGLQYVTEVDGVSGEHRELYDALERAGLLVPMHATIDGARNADGDGPKWVAPSGFDAVTKALFDASGAHLALGRAVSAIERVTTSHADGHSSTTWRVSSAGLSGGGDEQFDAVVLTMPVPHVLALGGAVAEALLARPELLEGLRGVQYSSRYALALFYAPDDERAAAFFAQLPWTCKYVPKVSAHATSDGARARARRGAEAGFALHHPRAVVRVARLFAGRRRPRGLAAAHRRPMRARTGGGRCSRLLVEVRGQTRRVGAAVARRTLERPVRALQAQGVGRP